MNVKYLVLFLACVFLGCSPIKKINNNVIAGEFDKAIDRTIKELKKTKKLKNKIELEKILEDIFNRSVIQSNEIISQFKADGNPEFYDDIYFEYNKLIDRQEKLKNVSNARLSFSFKNYNSELINYRYKTSDYYLESSKNLIKSNTKIGYRNAYEYLSLIELINPNYKETRSLIDLCLEKGKDNFLLSVYNESNSVLFKQLQEDILNINGYGLNSKWKLFHTANDNFNGNFDYFIELAFKAFIISPERINERESVKEKNIKDGFTYVLDTNGNVMKDSLGNDIKVDKIVKISAKKIEFEQTKSAKVIAEVRILNKNKGLIDKFPLESDFWFRNIFIEFEGDKRCLSKKDIELSKRGFIPFPSDENLIFNNAENIKAKLKNIVYNSSK